MVNDMHLFISKKVENNVDSFIACFGDLLAEKLKKPEKNGWHYSAIITNLCSHYRLMLLTSSVCYNKLLDGPDTKHVFPPGTQ